MKHAKQTEPNMPHNDSSIDYWTDNMQELNPSTTRIPNNSAKILGEILTEDRSYSPHGGNYQYLHKCQDPLQNENEASTSNAEITAIYRVTR